MIKAWSGPQLLNGAKEIETLGVALHRDSSYLVRRIDDCHRKKDIRQKLRKT